MNRFCDYAPARERRRQCGSFAILVSPAMPLMGRTQEREIYARLDTASPSCDCEVHFKLTRLIAASLTCVVLEGD
jgi:hypothetical protein